MIGQTSPINHTRDGLPFDGMITPFLPKWESPKELFHPLGPRYNHRWQNIQGHISYYDTIKNNRYLEEREARIARQLAIVKKLGAKPMKF